MLSAINWQAGRLLLSGFVSRGSLGLFSLSSDLSGIPEQAIVKPVHRPLMSAFALVQDDPPRLQRAYLRSVALLVSAGVPLMLCIGLLARPAIRLALGERWLGAAPLVTVLALANIAPLFAAPFPPLAMALGRTDRLFRRNLLEAAIRLPALALGARLWGAPGVAGAQALAGAAITLNMMAVAGKMIGVSVARQALAPWRAMLAGGVAACVLLALRPLAEGQAGLGLFVALAFCAAGGIAAYAAALFALWRCAGQPEGVEASIAQALRHVAGGMRRRLVAL